MSTIGLHRLGTHACACQRAFIDDTRALAWSRCEPGAGPLHGVVPDDGSERFSMGRVRSHMDAGDVRAERDKVVQRAF